MSSLIQCSQFADLPNGMRLHFASAGAPGRPMVLFVHGFPEAWFAWEAQLEAFGANFYAVAVDLRGFNLSAKPADLDAYRPKKIVEDLAMLIAHLGYRETRIVAHDWGGALTWNLAIFAPQCVRKLVIVNAPHPYLFARELSENPAQQRASAYMNWLRKPGSEQLLAEHEFGRLDAMFRAGAGADHWYGAALRARYHAMWSIPGEHGSHGLTGGVNYYRASPLHPATEQEPRAPGARMLAQDWVTRVPVRVIWGMRDTALLPSLLDGLDSLCPDLRISRIADGSHWVIHEQPAHVNALIAAALDESG
ncbi:MAG: alpha/beta hydrolase [Steroidobacteraceae bacterium]|jgi:pimeloyl-ACP methyl ester carboxylesterase